MEIRKCPNCGKTDTSGFGFCIYCGKEFTPENAPVIHINEPGITIQNFNSAQNFDNQNINSNLTANNELKGNEKFTDNQSENLNTPRSFEMNLLIIFGYILTILGSFLGLIIIIYLITRKDYNIKRHGVIQLAIFSFYVVLIVILFSNGTIDMNTLAHVGQMEYNNLTNLLGK
ncbi:hypothetical protein [uncultured Methanobrevibacter sp.]|uniref:hypothetical protein n=1 Tax=uncultured Methanobrevibacter sp. TaxID=253161 RepID=UPI0025EFA085|nr:hypothetical protein [uncultured Methanobrevibacter sp.]